MSTADSVGFEEQRDRIGQLTMRNLDIADSRAKLDIYAETGLLSIGDGSHILRLDSDKG